MGGHLKGQNHDYVIFGWSLTKTSFKNSKFIKVHKLNTPIGSGNVMDTNNCEISICETRIKNKLIIFTAIDNLIKGASGQAVQNMNIAFNFKESIGLK